MNVAVSGIVVVDDSPTVCHFVELILLPLGYSVYTAGDAEQGLVLADKIIPSAIFIDYVLPGMNGRSFCEAIRCSENLKTVPLILMTSKGDELAQGLQSVYSQIHYLSKPFEPEGLVSILDFSLEGAL